MRHPWQNSPSFRNFEYIYPSPTFLGILNKHSYKVTDNKASKQTKETCVPDLAFRIVSLWTTSFLLLGSFLSYPSPNALSDTLAENAIFSHQNICAFSCTYDLPCHIIILSRLNRGNCHHHKFHNNNYYMCET